MTVNRPIKKETVKKYLTALLTTFSLNKMQRIAHMMLKFKILKIGTYINVITRTFSDYHQCNLFSLTETKCKRST